MDVKQIKSTAQENNFSGVISLSNKNQITYEEAFGYRDRANLIKNNIETRFAIASGTKIFTALSILKLIEQNKLSLDDKALDIVDFDFGRYDKNITIYELLNHISGMPDYFDEDEIDDAPVFDKPWYEFFEPEDYFPYFPKTVMREKDFNYNNGGYVLLAAIVSKVSGKKYRQYVKEEIFDAVGLKNSGFYAFDELPANTALGYIGDDDSYKTNIYKLPIVGGGDGGAYTTAHDVMVLWDSLLNGRIISTQAVDKFFNEYQEVDEKTGYYSGMWVHRIKKLYYLEGCDMGVSFFSVYNPQTNDVLTVASNTEDGAWSILDLL